MLRVIRITAQHTKKGVTYRVRFGNEVLNNTEKEVHKFYVSGVEIQNKYIVEKMKAHLAEAITKWTKGAK